MNNEFITTADALLDKLKGYVTAYTNPRIGKMFVSFQGSNYIVTAVPANSIPNCVRSNYPLKCKLDESEMVSRTSNYYIRTKDPTMAFDFLPRVDMIEGDREFQIHLCQVTPGRRALFECHGYSSFKELESRLLSDKYTSFTIIDKQKHLITPLKFIHKMRDHQMETSNMEYLDPVKEIIVDSEGFYFLDRKFA